MPSTRPCSSSTSTSFAISRRSQAWVGCPLSWRSPRRFPPRPSRNSSLTPRASHVAGELFKMLSCVDLFHVPYRGVQVFPALLAGEAQVYFGPLISSIGYIRDAKLRALAVTTTTRSQALPDVPAVSEILPGWYGIGAPKGTPAEVIE